MGVSKPLSLWGRGLERGFWYTLRLFKHPLRLKPKIRVILTIDDDPIFDRTLITLFRIVNAEDASKAYSSVAETLYQDFVAENQEIKVHSV